jgi:MFS family permease
MFTLFGITMGSWAGRIPALREGLGISHATLSMVLLCGGLGALLSHPVSSRLMAAFGPRRTVLIAGQALLAVLLCIGAAPNVPMLMLAVLMLGVMASCMNVAVQSIATRLEKTTGRSQMSKLHAWGCAGGLMGAALGSVMAGMHVKPFMHYLMLAMPVSLLLKLACDSLDGDDKAEAVEAKVFCLPRGPLIWLGALGFLGSMSEGSIADWSGVYLKDHFQVTDGFAPLALTAFSVMMLAARLCGDRMKARFGARPLVGCGALLSACGLFFAVFAPSALCALAGFAAAGMGLSLLFPFVYSAAGKEGPLAFAGVATMSYTGSLMGPPLVGTLAEVVGMQAAIGFIGTLSLAMALIASRASLLK